MKLILCKDGLPYSDCIKVWQWMKQDRASHWKCSDRTLIRSKNKFNLSFWRIITTTSMWTHHPWVELNICANLKEKNPSRSSRKRDILDNGTETTWEHAASCRSCHLCWHLTKKSPDNIWVDVMWGDLKQAVWMRKLTEIRSRRDVQQRSILTSGEHFNTDKKSWVSDNNILFNRRTLYDRVNRV